MNEPNFQLKAWDSEFFGRSIYSAQLNEDLTPQTLVALQDEIEKLRQGGSALFEIRLNSLYFHNIPALEELGFRFVDSRLEFRTLTRRADAHWTAPVGTFRQYQDEDFDQLEELTREQFTQNRSFKSRYNDRNYFTEAESHRYYMQWHTWALSKENPMFCIWEVEGAVGGFYSIIRQSSPNGGIPDYKVALAAVQPHLRSHAAQNHMQYWLFGHAQDAEWYTINSPALTNLSGLKNNIRANKQLSYVEAYLFMSLS